MDAAAHSVDALPDVQFVLRSRDFVPVRPESGFKADYVARLTHDSLADLTGTAHFERRRLLSVLFTRPRLQRYEDQTLVPAVTAAIAAARRSADPGTALTGPTDLLVLGRQIFLALAARIIGLDGLEDLDGPRFARYNDDFVQMERLARAKFIDDPEPLVEQALAAQERWRRAYFQPSWEDLERWFAGRPQDRARTADPEFLRRALADSLRLHANNVLIRTALAAAVLPSGIRVAAGEVVILDRRAANTAIERASGAQHGFDPYGRWDDLYPRYGLAFGGGAHTCIARPVVLGAAEPGSAGPSQRHGLGVTTLLALYAAGVRLDAALPPERYADMTRDTFRTFPVRFAAAPPVPAVAS